MQGADSFKRSVVAKIAEVNEAQVLPASGRVQLTDGRQGTLHWTIQVIETAPIFIVQVDGVETAVWALDKHVTRLE